MLSGGKSSTSCAVPRVEARGSARESGPSGEITSFDEGFSRISLALNPPPGRLPFPANERPDNCQSRYLKMTESLVRRIMLYTRNLWESIPRKTSRILPIEVTP